MNHHSETDTIAAICTAPGEGAIGILRLSGKNAVKIANRLFLPNKDGGASPEDFESHTMHLGYLVMEGRKFDRVLTCVMRAPHTYTGEDVAEIHCHGGPAILQGALEAAFRAGARSAEPGEFTKRAFLRGRIDLAQAEAVLELVRARTKAGAQLALRQTDGEFSTCLEKILDECMDLLVEIEANLDFPEEEILPLTLPEIIKRSRYLRSLIQDLLHHCIEERLVTQGARATIIGWPNVGKSSLLNALLGRERAIVTRKPGTTRDSIESEMVLDDLPVRLIDTAGLRNARSEAEAEGVKRTLAESRHADIILWVFDGSRKGLDDQAIKAFKAKIQGKNILALINKSDLPAGLKKETIQSLFPEKVMGVSAKTGRGLARVKQEIRNVLVSKDMPFSESFSVNARQKQELLTGEKALRNLERAAKKGFSGEILSLELRVVTEAIKRILGRTVGDDVLGRIFSRFCIGK